MLAGNRIPGSPAVDTGMPVHVDYEARKAWKPRARPPRVRRRRPSTHHWDKAYCSAARAPARMFTSP